MVDVRLARLTDGPELARLRWQYASEGHASIMPLPEFRAEFVAFLAPALEGGRWGIWIAGRMQGTWTWREGPDSLTVTWDLVRSEPGG